jgi:type II secretion system protein J
MNINPHHSSAATGAAAFTLMELVLAMGVTAMLLVAIDGVFFSALRLRESTAQAVEDALPAQQTLTTLRRDLEGSMAPVTNGVFSGSFKAGSVTSTGMNQPVDIELYTTTGALRANQPWGEVQRVTYALRPSAGASIPGKELIRSVTRNILAAIPAPPEEQRMMQGIDTIEFSCYDGMQWRNYWDTTLTDTNLPSAVRVRIHMSDPSGGGSGSEQIELVAPILVQPRGIPTRQ